MTDAGFCHIEGERPRRIQGTDESGTLLRVRRNGLWHYFRLTGRTKWGKALSAVGFRLTPEEREGMMREAQLTGTQAQERSRPPSLRYTVEAGRRIFRDGQPFIAIERDNTRQGAVSPTEVDAVTHVIAHLLNEVRQEP